MGSIIGADVYVATAIGARLIGPASLVVWVLAGLMASVIALSFAHCAMFLPRVGGPYAYTKEASGPFGAFIVGWGLLLAEWFSLAVFPVAFAQYFVALLPGIDALGKAVLKGAFIAIVLVSNVVGVRTAGRINDFLTILKLGPLVFIVLGGLVFAGVQPGTVTENLTPFFTGNLGSFGQALVLIFWAYAGFEHATLPADEIRHPERTIPKAIVIGMLVVTTFYLLTNFVVIGAVTESTLAASGSPLIDAAKSIFGSSATLAGGAAIVVGVGALLSITGADESGTIGTSRLAFAMSIDGYLPRAFSRTHPRFHTPYLGLIVLCSTAYIASLSGGLSDLINASVSLLAVAYFATCLSALVLARRRPSEASRLTGRIALPVVGAAFSILLLALVNPLQIAVSLALLACGIPIYAFFSPKQGFRELQDAFLSAEAVRSRALHQSRRFLARAIVAVRAFIRRSVAR